MGKNNLSIYLIKEGIDNFEEIKEKCTILIDYGNDKKIYYGRSEKKEPKWLKEFFDISSSEIITSNARVLFLRRLTVGEGKTRIFGLTFGYGKSFFKEDVVEEQFGLKVVLNSVDSNKIRKISKVDISKNYKQSQEQLPNENDFSEFGFDIDTDLIKFVSGKSNEIIFENAMLTGGDLFNVTLERNIENIDELLAEIYKIYQNDSYKTRFPWIDNIKQVRNKTEIEELNQKAVDYLNEGKFAELWIAIPEILNWEKINEIKISGSKTDEIKLDIDMNDFMGSFNDNKIQNVIQLKNKKIIAISRENNDEYKKWSAYKCLVGSIEHNGGTYSINSGTWFKVDKNYKDEIEREYENIEIFKEEFIKCPSNMYEDEYNKILENYLEGSKQLHKKNVYYGGGRGNSIEVCDLIYKNNLIHIKANSGSSYLSHLFNQATVSCSLLKDNKFREKCNRKFEKENIDLYLPRVFRSEEYNVVLGIITNQGSDDSRPNIPFFSKVSLKYAKEKIVRDLGYNLYIKNIY